MTTIKAAGAVAWRPRPDGEIEVLLVHRPRYDDWSLPKGKSEPGEPGPVTAVREVLEEGGAAITLGPRLARVRYKVSGHPKRVSYWSGRVRDVDPAAVPNEEVDEIAWLPPARARSLVSYRQDAEVLAAFAAFLAGTASRADTVPLILLRHAKAEPKSDWPGKDDARPLAERGRADAAEVTGLLACFAPAAEVFTSPALRCEQTVRPYAEAAKVPVRRASALHRSRTGDPGCDAFLASVIASGKPSILCAHRENLPALAAAARRVLGAAPPDESDPLPTAGFRVLHVTGGEHGTSGQLAADDRYDLSAD